MQAADFTKSSYIGHLRQSGNKLALEEGLMPMINRGTMRGHCGRETSPANQEAFLPKISVQDHVPLETQQEVTSGVILHQFNILVQQV